MGGGAGGGGGSRRRGDFSEVFLELRCFVRLISRKIWLCSNDNSTRNTSQSVLVFYRTV